MGRYCCSFSVVIVVHQLVSLNIGFKLLPIKPLISEVDQINSYLNVFVHYNALIASVSCNIETCLTNTTNSFGINL